MTSELSFTERLADNNWGSENVSTSLLRDENGNTPPGSSHGASRGELSENSHQYSQEKEDNLRLRQIGISDLLRAIKSQRKLFGKKLTGIKDAFAAIDRDGDGIIYPVDLQNAMKRLDIQISEPASEELVRLLLKSAEQNDGGISLKVFITLVNNAAGDCDEFDALVNKSMMQKYRVGMKSKSSTLRPRPRPRPRKKRRRRRIYEDPPPDARADEDLMWDIEAYPEDPKPLAAYAERLMASGKHLRAAQYLRRSLDIAESEMNMQGASTTNASLRNEKMNLALRDLCLSLRIQMATAYALEEHFGVAQQLYEEAVETAPLEKKAIPLSLYASLLERLRNYDKAEEAYLRALALDSEHSQSLLGLANLLSDIRGDANSAETYYVRALDAATRDFHDADVDIGRARNTLLESLRCFAIFKHRVTGNTVEALTLLRRALAIPPRGKHSDILVEIGCIKVSQLESGDFQDDSQLLVQSTAEYFEKALESNPTSIRAKIHLAILLSKFSRAPADRKRATKYFEDVLRVDGQNLLALYSLAQHLDFTGQGAPRYIESLYRQSIDAVDAHHRSTNGPTLLPAWKPRLAYASFLEFRRQDVEAAEKLYEATLQVAPHEPSCLCALATFKMSHRGRDIAAAETLFRSALDSAPMHIPASLGLADLLWHHRSEPDPAEVLYKRAVSHSKSADDEGKLMRGPAFRQYALFLSARKKYRAAAKNFRLALKYDPLHAPTRIAYALVLAYHIRDYERAEKQLLRSLEIAPSSVEALYHLGRLYEEQVVALKGLVQDEGEKARARALQCYQNCIDIDPQHVPTLIRLGSLLAQQVHTINGTVSDREALLDRALQALSRAVAASGDKNADSYYAFGSFQLKHRCSSTEDIQSAQRSLQKAVSIDPCHVLAIDELAYSFELLDRLDEAENLWIQALDVNPALAPSHADFVTLLERVRSRCYNAESAVLQNGSPEEAKRLVLHQQLRKFATLKAICASRSDDQVVDPLSRSAKCDVWIRHSRGYLQAFRDQFSTPTTTRFS